MENLNTLIIGYGKTGKAVQNFLKKNTDDGNACGVNVNTYNQLKNDENNIMIYDEFLNDDDINKLNQNCEGSFFFNNNGAEYFLKNKINDVGQTVISPGIHRNNNVVLKLRQLRKPIYGEIEFAYENLMQNYYGKLNNQLNNQLNNKLYSKSNDDIFSNDSENENKNPHIKNNKYIENINKNICSNSNIESSGITKPKIIAITGTNGKTTATSMCSAAMEYANIKAFTGGNFGIPFIEGIKNYNDFILEVSSFQLEWIYKFNPDIAVLLNIQDDHLDRYENFDEYRLTKYKIFKNHCINETAILNYEDYNAFIVKDIIGSLPILFGFNENKCNIFYKNENIYFKLKEFYDIDYKISLKDFKDKRKFVIEDMMAASGALLSFGVPLEALEQSFKEYKLLKHRVEFIGSINNINFYDDSKATNPAAVISALESINGSAVILILGGKDKGFNYDVLIEPVKNYVKACVLIGETADIIYKSLNNSVELINASDMQDAVEKAYDIAAAECGNNTLCSVLLSPASSSFDMFKDYNERGEIFKKCFGKLKETKSKKNSGAII
ncbi:MAG: UDP-N-acetylmuramoyl-L-alanine--D-glutamate ligase [Candidatus Acididesulfobacter diazotrophicus]|uniref:UDP-N-acetylmuramoylalanine--D-glutamate ligase n=1 Tax=Candidatus Acididesulfobacter diazotrophicus TaxID=2597226 RepID=A0A519BND9_9DELT|nr:MAG: UDP-N-acetylmuramoyl-L-alanine--D-glutamate ligase [Candidatus Acididesulfobacter diazotrophicus]